MEPIPAAAPPTSVPPMVHASAPRDADTSAARRTWYSQHLVAAQFFADTAVSACPEGRPVSRQVARGIRDLVAASILSCAAYLEVSVSELFVELRDGHAMGRSQSRRLLMRFAREWQLNDQASALDRYQRLLAHFDADTFHPKRSPYLEVDRIMRWREELLRRAAGAPLRLEGAFAIAAQSDTPPPSLDSGSMAQRPTHHPGRLRLVPASAQWAVQSSVRFSAEFCRRMRLPNRE